MFKRKNRQTKLPGGNTDPALVEAQKAQQKANEKKAMLYKIFRTLYEMQCIYLSVEEVATLSYEEGGIVPIVSRRVFDENEQAKRMKFMEDRIADFHAMTKQEGKSLLHEALEFIEKEVQEMKELADAIDNPKDETPVLTDAVGRPIEREKKPDEQKPLQETPAKE